MATLVTTSLGGPAANAQPARYPTYYRTVAIDGLSIFYREAGPKDGPTILLLHGLPSSSRMFEPLFNRLAGRYHLVAPDYPGFGHSDWPDPKTFAYTFDRFAEIMTRFTEALAIKRYTLYMQDYGGPVGFRMALTHPERVEALILQDAVAACAAAGLPSGGEPRHVAASLWAAIHGVVSLELAGHLPADAGEVFEATLLAMGAGLFRTPSAPEKRGP